VNIQHVLRWLEWRHGALCVNGTVYIAVLLKGTHNGVGTNFGVGVGEARPEGPRAGDGVLGEATGSPSPPTRGFAGAYVSSLSGIRGGATAAEGFSCILSRQIAFPSISVRVAYSLHC